MESQLVLIISLLLTLIVLTMISTKLGISTPIFIVMVGVGISFIPGIPTLHVKQDLIFFILLPPLLYRAAWDTHWHKFWANRIPISLHGIGLVIVTAGGIGLLTHILIPSIPVAQGVLLGSIVAPPDALAATSILQKLKIPARTVSILEGESLINDATSLILFRFALMAVVSGQFSVKDAGTAFIIDSLVGIGIGCGIGGVIYLVHRFAPTTTNMDTLISLATPYLMYLTAEQLQASGVLAVVSGGLLLSYHASSVLSSSTRLQMLGVWETLSFFLNGLAFILVGFQLPFIIHHLHLEGISLRLAIGFGLLISLSLIGIRLAWMFLTTYSGHWLSPASLADKARPDRRLVVLSGWCGMRGVVTLASALSLPFSVLEQLHVPLLALMIFTAFSVIFFTLIVQGLSLPYLIRVLGITQPDTDLPKALALRILLANRALGHIQANYQEEALTLLPFIQHRERCKAIVLHSSGSGSNSTSQHAATEFCYHQFRQELVSLQRKELANLRRGQAFSEALLRQKEHELDLEQVANF